MIKFKEVIARLKSDLAILENTLNSYGSVKKNKTRSCVYCSSSDALSINKKNNTYKCFSCGAGGSVIDLIISKESVNFSGAIKILCSNNGIELPTLEYTEEEKQEFKKAVEDKKEINKYIFKLENELKSTNVDIDRKFRISCLIDKLQANNESDLGKLIKESEIINYSSYKPSKVYEINKYIGENKEGLRMAINEAKEGNKVLLLAPTGSGKTDSTINHFKLNNEDSCFISPNASNVEQIINKYDIPGAFGDIGAEDVFNSNNIKAFTWDKFAGLKNIELSNTIAIVDEIHQTFNDMYRHEKIKGLYANLDKCKGRIDITATPNKLDLDMYDIIIEYKQVEQTHYNVKLYDNINDDTVLKVINKSTKFALLENNTKNLEYYRASTARKSDIVTRSFVDTNKSETYDDIMKNSNIGDYDGILNTSIIIAGVNIYDKDITDIIIIGEKDISTIKQYVARFRDLKDVNVHIFNKYESKSELQNLEWIVSKKIEETQQALSGINFFNKEQFKKCAISLKPMKLEEGNNFYYDENLEEYKIDIPGIRNEVYSWYYRKADIKSFKELLSEYFDNIEIVNSVENKSQAKKDFTKMLKVDEDEAKNQLGKHLELLVGVNEIFKNKITPKLYNYLISNGLTEQYVMDQCDKYEIKSLINIGSNKKVIDLYTKYVLENNFTYEFSWHLCNLGNVRRGKIFSQLNKLVFRKIEQNYPQLINNNLVENKLHSLILEDFKPGISYTQKHLELFIEKLKSEMPGVKLSVRLLGGIINDSYTVEEKQTRSVNQIDNNFYKNIVPIPLTGKVIKINTIKDFKNIDDISLENNLSETSKKSLQNIIETRYETIISSKEAQEVLNINKIFNNK